MKIANELRRIVREETGLTISVGVSFCKGVRKNLAVTIKKPERDNCVFKIQKLENKFIISAVGKRFAFLSAKRRVMNLKD